LVQQRQRPAIVGCADQAAGSLLQLDQHFGHVYGFRRVVAGSLRLGTPLFDQRIVLRPRQPGDYHAGERLARHVHAFPEGRPEQHRGDVVPELLQLGAPVAFAFPDRRKGQLHTRQLFLVPPDFGQAVEQHQSPSA
jgi:hypothetical protein